MEAHHEHLPYLLLKRETSPEPCSPRHVGRVLFVSLKLKHHWTAHSSACTVCFFHWGLVFYSSRTDYQENQNYRDDDRNYFTKWWGRKDLNPRHLGFRSKNSSSPSGSVRYFMLSGAQRHPRLDHGPPAKHGYTPTTK